MQWTLRRDLVQGGNEVVDRVASFERMPQRLATDQSITIPTADPFGLDVVASFELLNDALHRTNGDAYRHRNVALTNLRVPANRN